MQEMERLQGWQWYHIDMKRKKVVKGKDKENNSFLINKEMLRCDEYKQSMINKFKSRFYALKGMVKKMPGYKPGKGRVELKEEKVIIFGRCQLNNDRRNREPAERVIIIGKETIALPIKQDTKDFSYKRKSISIEDLLK